MKQNRDLKVSRVFPQAPYIWKLLKIRILGAKDHNKSVLNFEVRGPALASPTPPGIRIVSWHTDGRPERLFRDSVCSSSKSRYKNTFYFIVLAIQAKKKRKNPKGRKSGNPAKEQDGPSTPASNSGNTVNSRETRSSQPR